MLCLVEIEANKINTLFWTWCLPNFHIFFILSVTLLVVSFSLGKKKKNKKKWGGGGWGWGKIMWSLESRKTKLVLCLGVKLKQTAWILMNMKSFKFSYIFYFEWHVVCGFLFPGKNNINKSNLGERGGSGCLLITSSKPCKSENFALDKT